MEGKKEIIVPQQAVYHLDGLDYLLLKTTPESCEYVFYDRYLQESVRGEIDLPGEPEMLMREILSRQERYVKEADVIPEEEFEKLQTFIFGEPIVRIVHTESEYLKEGQEIPFSEADELFLSIDLKTREKYGEDSLRFDRTVFEIEYMEYGRMHIYSGYRDLGRDGDSLIAQMVEHAQRETNEKYDHIIEDFVPYLNGHKSVGIMERKAQQGLKNLEENTTLDREKNLEYQDCFSAIQDYVTYSRLSMNCERNRDLLEEPDPEEYITDFEKEEVFKTYYDLMKKEAVQENKTKETAVEEHAANGYEKQEKKSAEHLSPYLQALIVGSAVAENGIYTMNAEELPYASFRLLKEECEREGISDHIIFGKSGDVLCQDLSDVYKIPELSTQKSNETPEIKKSIAPSM